MNIEINPPIKIGDKVYLPNKEFGSCNYLERYNQYREYVVNRVRFEYDMETNNIKWYFGVEGEKSNHSYIYTDKVAFTKEQLYESFREEIETLIPQEMRDYLWK